MEIKNKPNLSTKLKRFNERYKESIKKTEHKCYLCETPIYEHIDPDNPKLTLLAKQEPGGTFMCYECKSKYNNAQMVMRNYCDWLDKVPKGDHERADQLLLLQARDLIESVNNINYTPGRTPDFKKAYILQQESLLERFSSGLSLV